MLSSVFQEQLQERNRFLKKTYIPRSKMKEAMKWIETDLIKVVTGPRRAGKSIFLFDLLRNLNPAYINFDDDRLLKSDYQTLTEGIHSVYGDTRCVFLDEIQNLHSWELIVNQLQRRGYNVFITGSNANLLGGELATHLTGRYIPIEILPFSFQEYLACLDVKVRAKADLTGEEKGRLLRHLNDLMMTGGFPEIVVNHVEPEEYLNTLMNALLFKDVVKRYRIRYPGKMDELREYLINNVGNEITLQRLKRLLHFQSHGTLESYVQYLKEPYLVYLLGSYSYKSGERIRSPKKVYMVDNGYMKARSVEHSLNSGKRMENFVFTELLKKGWKHNENLFSYKTRNGKEVDFILKEGIVVKTLIQVCFQIDQCSTTEREEKALLEASEELSCTELIILTWDETRETQKNGKTLRFIPLWNWLLSSFPQ